MNSFWRKERKGRSETGKELLGRKLSGGYRDGVCKFLTEDYPGSEDLLPGCSPTRDTPLPNKRGQEGEIIKSVVRENLDGVDLVDQSGARTQLVYFN